jgi:small subunit ribosomal protein S1
VEGTITHLTKFGAFARLDEDLEGLIHISELSDQRINHPKEVVKEGDVVTLRVIKVDVERRRIGLSLRKVDSMAYANMDYEMMLSGEQKTETSSPEEEEVADVKPVMVEVPTSEAEPPAVEEPASEAEPPEVEEPAREVEPPEVEEPASEIVPPAVEEPANEPESQPEEEPTSKPADEEASD